MCRGVARIFQRGGGEGVTEATHKIVMSTSTPILTKTKLKTNFKKSGLFNNGFYGQDIVMAFSPPEYCRLFAQRRPTKGGSRAPQDLPLATPLVCVHNENEMKSKLRCTISSKSLSFLVNPSLESVPLFK